VIGELTFTVWLLTRAGRTTEQADVPRATDDPARSALT
jgi:hypothetical protein